MILRMETKKQRLDVTCSTFSRAEKSSFFFTPKDFFVLGSRKRNWVVVYGRELSFSIGSDSHASIAPSLSTSSSFSSFRFQSCTQLEKSTPKEAKNLLLPSRKYPEISFHRSLENQWIDAANFSAISSKISPVWRKKTSEVQQIDWTGASEARRLSGSGVARPVQSSAAINPLQARSSFPYS